MQTLNVAKIKKYLATGLCFLSLVQPLYADIGGDMLARQIQVFVDRPEVFADLYLGIGIPSDVSVLGNRLWYVKLDASVRSLAGVDSLSGFIHERKIPGIELTGTPPVTVGETERLLEPSAAQLRLLKMSDAHLPDDIMPTVSHFYGLEVLEAGDRISDRGAAFLKNLKKLRILKLGGPGVTDRSAAILATLPRLERVDLQGTDVSDDGIQRLAALPLREIGLGKLSTDRSLAALGGTASLEQLDLSRARITGSGLAALSKASRIHTLFLGSSITDADIPSLMNFKNLRRLDLTGARVSDLGAEALSRMTSLEEIALTRTLVSAATLANLARLPHLRYLEISGTGIDASHLSHAAVFPALQVISFSAKTKLSKSDIKLLAQWPKIHSILINGVLLGPTLVNDLRDNRSSRAYFSWTRDAEAAQGLSGDEVESALVLANNPPAVDKSRHHVFADSEGLPRIHQAEASLEDISDAPSNPVADTFQENEKNFLGEITVNAGSSKKQ